MGQQLCCATASRSAGSHTAAVICCGAFGHQVHCQVFLVLDTYKYSTKA